MFKAKGVRLSQNNTLENITIKTSTQEMAIYNDTAVKDLGVITLCNVTTEGQIYLVAEGDVKSGRVEADNVTVRTADVRGRVDRPHGFGVDVLQGLLRYGIDKQMSI